MNINTNGIDMITMIIGGLTLSLTFSWNELITDYITFYYPKKNDSLQAKTYYTVSLTFIIILLIFYLLKFKDTIQKPIDIVLNRLMI
jgi:hypothetical protein